MSPRGRIVDVRHRWGYPGFDVLHGVLLKVYAGEIICIIGPNGAGKSTVLRTIYGLVGLEEVVSDLEKSRLKGLTPLSD